MPYELYWFDKTEGIGMSYGVSLSGEILTVKNLKLSMYISQAYAKINEDGATYDPLTADIAKTSAAKRAAENATQVVAANTAKSDHEKLKAYLDYIKDAVSYNNEAANNNATPYGDPWQIIYVFDNDHSTNVVCEGYAKAFKHLCDLSSFSESDLFCSLVTGTMTVGTSAGPHMWNIVTIGGRNYLVDVTNCDADTVGVPDKLFLCGAAENVPSEKYTATAGSRSIVYEYDADTLGDYASSDLKLEKMPYSPTSVSGLTVSGTIRSYGSASESITVTLLQGTSEVATKTLTGASGSVPYSQNYSFPAVPAGTYTLKVEKANHITEEVVLTVDSTPVTQDISVYLLGDVNKNGSVNIADVKFLLSCIQSGGAGLDKDERGDINKSGGKPNTADVKRLLSHIEGNLLY